jgi:hypothetical protein
MRETINIFGAMMVFAFIQSSMPIIDKKAIKRDRHDMIKYWALNSIPVEAMFWAFTQVFNLKREMFKKTKDKSKPEIEMEESEAKECLAMLQKCVPDIFQDLKSVGENFFEYLEKKRKKGNMTVQQFLREKHMPTTTRQERN